MLLLNIIKRLHCIMYYFSNYENDITTFTHSLGKKTFYICFLHNAYVTFLQLVLFLEKLVIYFFLISSTHLFIIVNMKDKHIQIAVNFKQIYNFPTIRGVYILKNI